MAAHRYWRIYATASANSYMALAEVQMRTSQGGSNVLTGGTASADSGTGAANCVDGNAATYWESGNGFPHWWKYDLGAGNAKDIVEFTLTAWNHGSWYIEAPTVFSLQYSDNDSTWTSALDLPIVRWFTPGEMQGFSTQALRAPHRYWRVYWTNPGATFRGVAEIQMRTSAGGSNVLAGGTLSADTVNGGNAAANALDANAATYWSSTLGNPHWWMYDFGVGNSKDIVELVLTARNDPSYAEAGNEITLQYSDNGTAWFTAKNLYPVTWAGQGQSQTFTIAVAVAAISQPQMFVVL